MAACYSEQSILNPHERYCSKVQYVIRRRRREPVNVQRILIIIKHNVKCGHLSSFTLVAPPVMLPKLLRTRYETCAVHRWCSSVITSPALRHSLMALGLVVLATDTYCNCILFITFLEKGGLGDEGIQEQIM